MERVSPLFDGKIKDLEQLPQSLKQENDTALDELTKKNQELESAKNTQEKNEEWIQKKLKAIQPQIKAFRDTRIEKDIFEEYKTSPDKEDVAGFISKKTVERLADATFQQDLRNDLQTMGLPAETIETILRQA